MDDEKQPWDRQENEPKRWFERFELYRLAGPGRSILGQVNAGRDQKGQKRTNNVPGSWRRMVDAWRWKERASAWDQHLVDEAETRWKAQIMGPSEVLARLSDQARATHLPFIRIDEDGAVFFNFADPEAAANFHLIKKIKTKRTRRVEGRGELAEEWEDEWVEVDLHDAQNALIQLGKHHKLFAEQMELTASMEVKDVDSEQHDRAISTLACAIGSILSQQHSGQPGELESAE